MLAEHLAGEAAAEVLLGPGVVHLVGAVDPVEEVGDPAGAALGQRDAQVGVGLDHPRPQQVGRRGLDVHRLQRDHHVGRRVDRGDRQAPRAAQVDRQHRAGVDARLPHRVPVVVVEAGVAERRGVLGEAERVAALGRRAPHLGGGLLGAPDRGHGHGDEAAGVGAAPLVDVPVVVGPHEGVRQVDVVAEERAGREGGERGEVHRGQHAAGVHVLDPLVDVVAAGPHLVEALRLHAVLLLGAAGHGVERRGLHHDLAELPHVGALVVAHQLGRPVEVLGVEVVDEEVGRLDEVVVDTDEDEVVDFGHGQPS